MKHKLAKISVIFFLLFLIKLFRKCKFWLIQLYLEPVQIRRQRSSSLIFFLRGNFFRQEAHQLVVTWKYRISTITSFDN